MSILNKIRPEVIDIREGQVYTLKTTKAIAKILIVGHNVRTYRGYWVIGLVRYIGKYKTNNDVIGVWTSDGYFDKELLGAHPFDLHELLPSTDEWDSIHKEKYSVEAMEANSKYINEVFNSISESNSMSMSSECDIDEIFNCSKL